MNPFDLLKNPAKMKEMMEEMQAKTAEVSAEGSAGGGMVKVVMNGMMAVERVTISPEAVDPNDVEMLQDLVLAAVSDAVFKVKEKLQEEMGSQMGLPGGFPGV